MKLFYEFIYILKITSAKYLIEVIRNTENSQMLLKVVALSTQVSTGRKYDTDEADEVKVMKMPNN